MARTRVLPQMLSRTALFRHQPGPVLDAVGAAMQEARFAPGQLIFSRGDAGKALYLVTEGRVRLSILTEDGRELSFAHAVAGEIFGEIAVLDGSCRSADATALGDVAALVLAASDFNRLIDAHASLARSVISFLCARLRDVSDRLEDIALLPLEARLARYFLNRASIGSGGNAAGAAGAPLVALGMSQTELALLLGASRPKVNVALMTLEEAGAISRSGQAFACDVAMLAEIARREHRST